MTIRPGSEISCCSFMEHLDNTMLRMQAVLWSQWNVKSNCVIIKQVLESAISGLHSCDVCGERRSPVTLDQMSRGSVVQLPLQLVGSWTTLPRPVQTGTYQWQTKRRSIMPEGKSESCVHVIIRLLEERRYAGSELFTWFVAPQYKLHCNQPHRYQIKKESEGGPLSALLVFFYKNLVFCSYMILFDLIADSSLPLYCTHSTALYSLS